MFPYGKVRKILLEMERQTWRETRCKDCVWLVTDGDIFHCSKKISFPEPFAPVYTNHVVLKSCPGVEDLPFIERNIQKSYDIDDNLRVIEVR